ncbi:MAG: LuxR C-terminal-related transcriptional regulator [Gammaproteobacteria bacterium]
MDIVQQVVSQLNTAIFAKDLSHRIIYCNERFAELSGEDSPAACQGKRDENFIWKKYAQLYQQGDVSASEGRPLCNVIEPQIHRGGDVAILLNKHPLLDHANKIIGIVASYMNVNDLMISKKEKEVVLGESAFNLGEYFGYSVLTSREHQVLKQVLLGYTAKKIASDLCISPKTAETYISRIKTKMQCATRGDIIAQAVFSGLYHRFLQEI